MTLLEIVTDLGPYFWVIVALVLIGAEMIGNTFDLLWVSAAALVAALVAWLAPGVYGAWQGQLAAFAIASLLLVVAGRTVFAGLRVGGPLHPHLNRRMERLTGRHGVATADFVSGTGRVKIGDTVWSAQTAEGIDAIAEGTTVVVEGSRSTTVIVRPV